MTEAATSRIEASQSADPVPGPGGTDVISDVLRVFRVHGAALIKGECMAPWAWETPPASAIAQLLHPGPTRIVIFHIIARGSCWAEVDGCQRVSLAEGDIVGFPHGHVHRMGNGSAEIVPVAPLLPPMPWLELPTVVHGGDGAPTQIVCVYLRCDDLPFDPIASGLPAMLVMRRDAGLEGSWFESNVQYLVREAREGRPGGANLIARLTEMMFVEILRLHMAALGERDVGLLAALNDRFVRRALTAIHARPLEAWTAETLAREAGLSRSALDQRFRRLLEMPPMRYLTVWRLQLAAQALLGGDGTVATAATAAGYGSVEAFSRAFHRSVGVSPAAWRRSRGLGLS
jgi:AraC family transcriptional regulator, alkane utilization regulator